MSSQSRYRELLARANKTSDYVVLSLTFVLIIVPFLISLLFDLSNAWYLAALLLVVFVLYFVVRMQQVSLLSNALRIQNSSFHALRHDIDRVSEDFGLPYIDVYIVQNPYLNAYAMGFANPYAIVLHSATVERLTHEELRAIVIHEIAHIVYRHTHISIYVTALGGLIPVFGSFIMWCFGFWSRRAEYTADRLATVYTGTPDVVMRALIKVYVGPDVARYIEKEQLMFQDYAGRGMMRRFAQSLGTHPFLVNRLKAILRLSKQYNLHMADDLSRYIDAA